MDKAARVAMRAAEHNEANMRMQTAGIALLISLTSLAGAPAQAAPPEPARQERVAWRDLDLTTTPGTRVFWTRVRAAARNVCGEPGAGLHRYVEVRRCQDQVTHQAAQALATIRRAQPDRLAQAPTREADLEGRVQGVFDNP